MGRTKETRFEQVSSILIFSRLLINYEHNAEDEKRVERERVEFCYPTWRESTS